MTEKTFRLLESRTQEARENFVRGESFSERRKSFKEFAERRSSLKSSELNIVIVGAGVAGLAAAKVFSFIFNHFDGRDNILTEGEKEGLENCGNEQDDQNTKIEEEHDLEPMEIEWETERKIPVDQAMGALLGDEGLMFLNEMSLPFPKLNLIILEARDRVGGRVHTTQLPPSSAVADENKEKNLTEPPIWVDLGASFIHGCASWNPVYQIALALGVDVRTDFGGYSVAWGQSSSWFKYGRDSQDPLQRGDKKRRKMCAKRDVSIVFKIAIEILQQMGDYMQERGDDCSVYEAFNDCFSAYLKQTKKEWTPMHQKILESVQTIMFGYCADFRDVSMLSMVTVMSEGGETSEEEEAKDGIVVDGYHFLVKWLSNQLDVSTNEVVKKIQMVPPSPSSSFSSSSSTFSSNSSIASPSLREYQEKRIRVTTKKREIEADYVIVTLPLAVLQQSVQLTEGSLSSTTTNSEPGHLDDAKEDVYCQDDGPVVFEPPLPTTKKDAINRLGMGNENKIFFSFGKKLNQILPTCNPYIQCLDSRFRFLNLDYFGKCGVIVAHSSPPFTSLWKDLSDSEIYTPALEILQTLFPKLGEPLSVYVTRWGSDPLSGGSYSYYRVGSSSDDIEEIYRPIAENRIHFAGEALSLSNTQCVAGALETGRSVALAIIQHILGEKPRRESDLELCFCREKKIGETTITCGICLKWFHVRCVTHSPNKPRKRRRQPWTSKKVKDAVMRQLPDQWRCPTCEHFFSSQEISQKAREKFEFPPSTEE